MDPLRWESSFLTRVGEPRLPIIAHQPFKSVGCILKYVVCLVGLAFLNLSDLLSDTKQSIAVSIYLELVLRFCWL